MRFLSAGLLSAALALPVAAQAPRFIKIDVQVRPDAPGAVPRAPDAPGAVPRAPDAQAGPEGLLKRRKTAWGRELPEKIEIRMPLSLVKAALEGLDIDEEEIKINGKGKKGVKVAQLIDLLKDARAGDMLLEVKTSNGDLVKITLE